MRSSKQKKSINLSSDSSIIEVPKILEQHMRAAASIEHVNEQLKRIRAEYLNRGSQTLQYVSAGKKEGSQLESRNPDVEHVHANLPPAVAAVAAATAAVGGSNTNAVRLNSTDNCLHFTPTSSSNSNKNNNYFHNNSSNNKVDTILSSLHNFRTESDAEIYPATQYQATLNTSNLSNGRSSIMQQQLLQQQHLMEQYGQKQITNELMRNMEALMEKNAVLENEVLVQRRKLSEQQQQQQQEQIITAESSERFEASQQLQAALLEKLRMEEIVELMKEEIERLIIEQKRYESRILDLELAAREQAESESQLQKQQSSTSKRIEEQLKTSNFHFVSAQKKIDNLERNNKELVEKLAVLQAEKKKISLKWAAASQKGKIEEKLKSRVKELEFELIEKTNEYEEFKRKYLSTNAEFRNLKESESSYKESVEYRFRELRERWQAEISQKDELIKQNNQLLSQLQEFSVEFNRLQNIISDAGIDREVIFSKAECDDDIVVVLNAVHDTVANEKNITKQQTLASEESSMQQSNPNHQRRDIEVSSNELSLEKEVEYLSEKLRASQEEGLLLTQKLNEQTVSFANLQGEKNLLSVQLKHLSEAMKIRESKGSTETSSAKKSAGILSSASPTMPIVAIPSVAVAAGTMTSQYYSFLEQLSILCDAQLFETMRRQLHAIVTSYQSSNSLQIQEPAGQRNFEHLYYEQKRLYDRLLNKYSSLQQQAKSIEQQQQVLVSSTEKKKGANFETNYSNSQNSNYNHRYRFGEARKTSADESKELYTSQSSASIYNSRIFREELRMKRSSSDGKQVRPSVSSNKSEGRLIQDILRNEYNINSDLSHGSQKMLSSLLVRLFESEEPSHQNTRSGTGVTGTNATGITASGSSSNSAAVAVKQNQITINQQERIAQKRESQGLGEIQLSKTQQRTRQLSSDSLGCGKKKIDSVKSGELSNYKTLNQKKGDYRYGNQIGSLNSYS